MSNQERVQAEIMTLTQKKRKDMSPRERVRLLQLKLYLKAKQDKQYRFYVLYDKVFLPHILEEAYKASKSKNGSPGIDKQSFTDIEAYGRNLFLKELQEELRTRTYKPQAVKRVWIEKESGGERPLGLPTIKDRVAQTACKMVIEPIFEADFEDSSYGFRPKRSAKDAIKEIKNHLKKGRTEVYDADLSQYFDTIPHDKLLLAIRERIADPRVLHLIRLWLKVPVVEEGKYTGGKKNGRGTPQGGVISPLLANIYLHLLDRIVNNPNSSFARQGIRMVRYADDFILMAHHMGKESLSRVHSLLHRMELQINTEKSRLVQARDSSFQFLGFTVSYDRSILKPGNRFWSIKPSAKAQKRIRQKINGKLKKIGHYPAQDVAKQLNPIIRGWLNYYKIEKVSCTQVACRDLHNYLVERLYRYYNRKSQRKTRLYGQRAFDVLVENHGLINPYVSSTFRPVNAF